jgi:hypothetical protein
VSHSRVSELRIRVNRARDEAAEVSGRGRSVEAMIVVQHAFEHLEEENLSACLK